MGRTRFDFLVLAPNAVVASVVLEGFPDPAFSAVENKLRARMPAAKTWMRHFLGQPRLVTRFIGFAWRQRYPFLNLFVGITELF